MEEEEAPATAMPPPPSSSSSTAAQESRMRTHREYHAQERYPMEGQWRARGVAPLPPPPLASHSSFVEGTRHGRSPRLPSCSRRRTTSACPCCCAARWSGGIRNYGSLKEGEGDKEFDGVTKNSMRVMRRV